MHIESNKIPIQAINDSTTQKYGINLYVLRTDLNHPTISGNKLFKLKYNIQEARKKHINTLLTFGGAFSNHIAATAAAGKEYNFKTVGIIRGEEYKTLNPTLQFAKDCGMEIRYVPRTLFKNKNELLKQVHAVYPEKETYVIPEGGSNELGIKGCKEITESINSNFDYVCAPCGTGATITGIILSLKSNQKAVGFQVLKGEHYIKNEVVHWLKKLNEHNVDAEQWSINEDYHFGGYAKINDELRDFVAQFKQSNNIPLDYVYTGKMMFGIYDQIKKGVFKKGETIIAVHTGGLQGNEGFK